MDMWSKCCNASWVLLRSVCPRVILWML